ncbi:MAG: hypothetical protein DWQ37_00505 [Planctomycetota bacterium]|nr:MAG: hypothetical protein DWQ37_00505 [Planctomycetota bacterium]
MPFTRLTSALGCCLLLAATAQSDDLGIRVPAGFEVSRYADDALAHDIYSMTIDACGRVVVAGRGYVKTLHDDDGDGRADRYSLFSEVPESGAHGMYFDGSDLICTGDNSVMRLIDRDGNGSADGKVEIWTRLRHPEHGANGLIRGPDGCYWLICGNDAGVCETHAASLTSPVKHPRCGAVIRFSAEGKPLDVYAHGFRNPYDLDIDAHGHVLTVDSDGERDHHLPWYAPTRLFDVAQGMEHGWLLKGWTRSWNRPQSFFDAVDRLAEIGRGSPTGVVVYRHDQFPEHYRNGVFAACWTFGRVYFFPLDPAGATCETEQETFMETAGDIGFAPCDLAVGPEGDLFVAIGGRRTLGSVFRVRYVGQDGSESVRRDKTAMEHVLLAPQPLASWSRAKWVPAARELGRAAFEEAAIDEVLDPMARVRAMEVLVEVFDGVDARVADVVSKSDDPAVRARVAWALGRREPTSDSIQILAALTADDDAAVQRAAWEALATSGRIDPQLPIQPDWARGLNSPERRVRSAAIAVARHEGHQSYEQFAARVRVASDALRLRLAQLRIGLEKPLAATHGKPAPDLLSAGQDIFAAAEGDVPLRLEAVRLLQIALGDLRTRPDEAEVYSGYVGEGVSDIDDHTRRSLVDTLAPGFPSGNAELDRELARLLGMLNASHERLLNHIARKWTPDSSVEDDIHYLIVASLLRGERSTEFTQATADCLLQLHQKLDRFEQFPSRNWPLRVAEAFDELCQRDRALAEAIAESPRLNHVGHALFVERLSENQRLSATRKLWQATVEAGDDATAELVDLAGNLPSDEALALLRPQWDTAAPRDAIVLELAKFPRSADRNKFIEGLASPQPAVVERAAQALLALGIESTPADMAQALRALKRACALGKQVEPRRSLVRLLEFWTKDGADVEWSSDPTKAYIGWYKMFAEHYPAEAAKLQAGSGADFESWKQRLADLDWASGDATRGRKVFERRSCHRCHEVRGHLGPELQGAVSRMTRDDLFAAILEPNLEVSPTYMTTMVVTDAGQVYHGLIVYESPESTLLQTGPDTTVRITNTQATSMRPSRQSLMPSGLLDPCSDQELCDLYSYLKTLASP